MFSKRRFWLIPAAIHAVIALLHLAIIFGGPAWYRFFGAGEQMAHMAEMGSAIPTVVTSAISTVFVILGIYSLSAAGLLRPLPMLRSVLAGITFILLFRGLAGLATPLFYRHPAMAVEGITFWIWSSLICVAIGLVHLNALVDNWRDLRPTQPL